MGLEADLENMNLDEEIPVEAGKELNFVRLSELMDKTIKGFEQGQVDIVVYTEMYFEWCKLFRHFGNALVVAFKGKSYQTILILFSRHH